MFDFLKKRNENMALSSEQKSLWELFDFKPAETWKQSNIKYQEKLKENSRVLLESTKNLNSYQILGGNPFSEFIFKMPIAVITERGEMTPEKLATLKKYDLEREKIIALRKNAFYTQFDICLKTKLPLDLKILENIINEIIEIEKAEEQLYISYYSAYCEYFDYNNVTRGESMPIGSEKPSDNSFYPNNLMIFSNSPIRSGWLKVCDYMPHFKRFFEMANVWEENKKKLRLMGVPEQFINDTEYYYIHQTPDGLNHKTMSGFSYVVYQWEKALKELKMKGETLKDNTFNAYAGKQQLDSIFSLNQGFYIGGGYHFNGDGHMLTVGGSGAGKGVNFIIPALLSPALVASGSSVVVLDPKGENLAICGEHLKKNGYNLIVINPFDIPEIAGFGKACFNPFSLTSKDDINAPKFCDLIAECLISDNNKDDHWNESARQYISLYLLYMVATEQANFKNLFEAVRLGGADRLEYLGKMKDCDAFDGIISATAGGIAMQMMASKDSNSGEIDSIFSAVRRGTEKFKDLQLREHLKHSDFDLKTIAHEKNALFVCVNPSELKEFSPWLRVLFGCMFNTLKKHYNTKRRVLFLMDEFPQIGRLKEFQTAMVYMRGYNATLWVIVQDLGQLKQLYWDSWESFVGSASVKMWLPLGADNFTIDYLSKRMPEIEKNMFDVAYLGTLNEDVTKYYTKNKTRLMSDFELITCKDALIEGRELDNIARFEKIPYWLLPWAKNASPNPFRK